MDLEQGDIEKFQEAINKFGLLMDKLPNGSSNSEIHINAGGIGIWLCTTACFVMLACMVVGGVVGSVWVGREFSRVDAVLKDRKDENDSMKSYLSAIYMQAPQLKPKEEKDHGN